MASCETLGWVSEGVLVAYTHDRAIDVLGCVQTAPGTYDEEGVEITPPVMDMCHHVNFQGVHPVEWDAYIVLPNSPSRIFAGSGTAADPYAEPETELET